MTPHTTRGAFAAPVGILLCVLTSAACGELFGPEELCSERDGVRICVDRSEYGLSQDIAVTISNNAATTIFQDVCSVQLLRSRSSRENFPPSAFDPRRRCGEDATLDDAVAQMREVGSGATVSDVVVVPAGSIQGFYRINYWLLNEDGDLISTTPYFSGTFDVFPSAG